MVRVIYPAVLCVMWAAMIIAVNPIGDFPLNDDWAWGQSVKTLQESGVFTMPASTDAAVVTQILWGYVVCLPFGFSFTVLRLATAVLGLVVVLTTYALCREGNSSRWLAFLCALATAANPLIFESSNTFMTEVPFLAFFLLSLLCLVRAARSGSLPLALAAIAFAVGSTLTRQIGAVIPLLFVIACVCSRILSLRTLLIVVALFGILHVAVQQTEGWLRASGQLGPNYGRMTKVVSERLRHLLDPESVRGLADGLRIVLIYVGFFSLPPVVAALPQRLRTRPSFLVVAAALAGGMMWVAVYGISSYPGMMPFNHAFNLTDLGLGPNTLTDVYFRNLPHLPQAGPGFWNLVTRIGVWGGGLLVFVSVLSGLELITRKPTAADKPARLAPAMALAFLGAYGLVCVLTPFDRYFVPLFPAIVIGAVWGSTMPRRGWVSFAFSAFTGGVALAGILLQLGFSVAATHDYLAWNRARWTALHELIEHDGATPDQIDGGFEFNSFYRYGLARGENKSPWWVQDDLYMIAFGPLPGYRTLRAYPYRRWIGSGEGAILALVRDPS